MQPNNADHASEPGTLPTLDSSGVPPLEVNQKVRRKIGTVRRNCTCCLGAVAGIILVLIIAGTAIYFFTKPLRREADVFISSKVVPAMQKMNVESLKPIATPEFAQELETSRTAELINAFYNKLGALKSLDEEQEGQYNLNLKGGFYIYRSTATFEKTTGTINLIFKRNGTWKLHGFKINSDALILN